MSYTPLTDEQIDDLSREMVKGSKSVNWLARKIEASTAAPLLARIAELEAALAEASKDAQRYCYLVAHLADRRESSALHAEWDKIDAVLDCGAVPPKKMFDAAIDAAMKGTP